MTSNVPTTKETESDFPPSTSQKTTEEKNKQTFQQQSSIDPKLEETSGFQSLLEGDSKTQTGTDSLLPHSDDSEHSGQSEYSHTSQISIDLIQPKSVLRVSLEVFHKNTSVLKSQEDIALNIPIVATQQLFAIIKNQFEPRLEDHSDWEVESNRTMAQMQIRDVTKLIPEYDGKEKALDSFIKKLDKLWTYIAAFDENDKTQFLLVLQLKLIDKAAEAVQNNDFNDWEAVKADLIAKITPHRNTEKSELKLCAIKQLPSEDVETYAKRIEDALDTLNRSFSVENQSEVVKRENDRKARKTFENGLIDATLRNKAISKGSSTLKEAVDYVIEQELRYSELKPNASFCTYCKKPNHTFAECRSRQNANRPRNSNPQSSKPSTPSQTNSVTCFKCGKKGHYANECKGSPASNLDRTPRTPSTKQVRSRNMTPNTKKKEIMLNEEIPVEQLSPKN